jgi:hypothetical protein
LQDEYNRMSVKLLHDLWSRYATMFEGWLDGGVGPDLQDNVTALINELQPTTVYFNGGGVTESPVRWCGTEDGNPPG